MGKESDCNAEPEEGEIIDDDDLEAISDDSITPGIGKLNSHKESLCALSLSSVSEGEVHEDNVLSSFDVKRKICRRSGAKKRRRLSKHHHRRSRSNSSSSNEDEKISLTKKLLKEAIRIDNSTRAHNNSLRTRLKGMVEMPPENSEIVQIEASYCDNVEENPERLHTPSPDIIEQNKISSEEIIDVDKESICSSMERNDEDDELIQLRLEALKTAMINKYHYRKQRKNCTIQDVNNLEVNKENSCDNSNSVNSLTSTNFTESNVENADHGNSVNNSEEDEDEDILRAILLASISKKITNKISTPSTSNTKLIGNTKTTISTTRNRLKTKTKPTSKPFIAPKIERFIISVNNSDSDSDDNVANEDKESRVVKKDEEKDVEKQVEQFLKKQRAEVEAKRKEPQKLTANSQKSIETNDLYKLLPKNKQIEYEKLIQKLKTAEKKPKENTLNNVANNKPIRTKITAKNDITEKVISVNEVISVKKHVSLEKTNKSVIENKNLNVRTPKSKVSCVSELNTIGSAEKRQLRGAFQSSLKDLQIQKNGSFQIRGKYSMLSSLLQKMNESSNRQKRHQLRIKSLLSQLRDARNDYQKSQDEFHLLLREFFKKKEEIDKRQFRRADVDNKKPTVTVKHHQSTLPQKIIQPKVEAQKEELLCKVVLEKCPVDLTDPNDIEFKTIDRDDALSVPKYISPLDSKGGTNKMNPLEILCPFEMNGSCRDKECSFNHYNKES